MQVTVVVPPEHANDLGELLDGLADHDVSVVAAMSLDTLPALVDRAVAAGADVIGVVGGNGAQRAVAARLAGTETALCVVPDGTANRLAATLGVDGMAAAAAAIVDGERRVVELAIAGDLPFVMAAAMGYDPWTERDRTGDDEHRDADLVIHVGHEAPVDDEQGGEVGEEPDGPASPGVARPGLARRQVGGQGGIVAAFGRLVHHPRWVTVQIDGVQRFRGMALGVTVTNVAPGRAGAAADAPAAGAPAADDLGAGQLEVTVLRCRGVVRTLRALAQLAIGQPPTLERRRLRRGDLVAVRWRDPVRLRLDGEPAATGSSFDFAVEPAALRLCTRDG